MSQKKGCFHDIRLFVLCFGLLYLTDIMAGVMKKSSLTTIERRFDLPTTIIALLASSFQIGNLSMLIFVSYFGSRWNRPRTIFFGAILLVIGNVVMTLPQFIGDRYQYDDTTIQNVSSTSTYTGLCAESSNDTAQVNCEDSAKTTSTNQLYILLVIGQMLNGVGGTPLQPLGISYIDDFAHERNSPLYIGLTTAAALFGPMIGYIMSSVVLRIWVDFGWVNTDEITIQPTHPSWVGAWWLGLLICTSGIVVTLIPFWFFPKTLENQKYKSKKKPDDNITAEEKPKEVSDEGKKDDEPNEKKLNIKSEFRGMLEALKRFAKNKLYLLIIVKFYFTSASMVAIINFFPKYLEVMFGVSASRASFLTGVINMPCIVVGILIGSFTMKRLNLSMIGTAKLIVISTFFATLAIIPMAFVGCDSIDVAGITTSYSDSSSGGERTNAISECNADCKCKDGVYTPVCGADGISYISPCHAGCSGTTVDDTGAIMYFTDCECIQPPDENMNTTLNWAVNERCEFSKCPNLLYLALALKSTASFFGGVTSTPIYVFMIRSVDKADKSFAIGINLLLIRLLAWIPGPLLYGMAIDSACIYWGIKPCSDKGYCKLYDNAKYRHIFYGLVITFQVLTFSTAIVIYFMSRKKYKDVAKDDEKKEEQNASPVPEESPKVPNVANVATVSTTEYLNEGKKPLLTDDDSLTDRETEL